jgi:hypothetical protein
MIINHNGVCRYSMHTDKGFVHVTYIQRIQTRATYLQFLQMRFRQYKNILFRNRGNAMVSAD